MDAIQFIKRPVADRGGRLAITEKHQIVAELLKTATNGMAIPLARMPSASVRVWLRSRGLVVRGKKVEGGFTCWCEPLEEELLTYTADAGARAAVAEALEEAAADLERWAVDEARIHASAAPAPCDFEGLSAMDILRRAAVRVRARITLAHRSE